MPTCTFCNHTVSANSTKCSECGAALFENQAVRAASRSSSATDGDVVSMLEQGRKGDAVRMYREQTGAGMREAIAAVDLLERGENAPAARSNATSTNMDADLKSYLWALLQTGQKNEALTLYRARTGGTPRTARAAVAAVAREHGIEAQRSGCLSVLVMCVAVTGLLYGLIA